MACLKGNCGPDEAHTGDGETFWRAINEEKVQNERGSASSIGASYPNSPL